MHVLLRRLCVVALALAISLAALPPKAAVAQSTGVGLDGYTRLLWRNVNGNMAVWKLDSTLNVVAIAGYGPYTDWAPIAITSGNNNDTYVLWRNIDGTTVIWALDPNLNFLGQSAFGPIDGWTAESLSTDTSGYGLRLQWKSVDDQVSIWSLDQNINLLRGVDYGPFAGYDPGPVGDAIARSLRLQGRSRHSLVTQVKTMPATKQSLALSVQRAARAMAAVRHSAVQEMLVK